MSGRVADGKAADDKTGDNKAADNKAADNKAADNKAGENEIASTQVAAWVSVVLYRRARLQLAQLLIPIATVVTIFARATFATPLLWLAFALLAATAAILASSRKSLGRVQIYFAKGAFQFRGASEAGRNPMQDSIRVREVGKWTLDSRAIRVTTSRHSWSITPESIPTPELEQLLTAKLGPARVVRYRGSPGARKLALIIAISGFILTAFGIALQAPIPMVSGVACALIGLPVFGVLSQKIAS